MKKVLVLGGGKIGSCITDLLGHTGDYAVTVGDATRSTLERIATPGVRTVQLGFDDQEALTAAVAGQDMVVSAAPYTFTPIIAATAKQAGAHYLDLTEDVEGTRQVKALAEGAQVAMIPQCGLAPGFISIVAHDLAKRFDQLYSVKMRVGALPQFPTNALKYNLTWSTEGLINEYCNPCEAIVDGELREVPALEGYERLAIEGEEYEAFNTSGGLGTLWETLRGRVQHLDYKTMRYVGHRDIMKLLLNDLRLIERRDLLKDIFEASLPGTTQDVVLIFVSVTGMQHGRLMQETYAKKVYAREINGRTWTAIQVTTAGAMCAMVDLLRDGKLPQRGFVRQEETLLSDFLGNRFGRFYA